MEEEIPGLGPACRICDQALPDEILLLLVLQRVNALLDCFSCHLIAAKLKKVLWKDLFKIMLHMDEKLKFDSFVFVFCTCPPISPLFVSSSAAVSRAHIPEVIGLAHHPEEVIFYL